MDSKTKVQLEPSDYVHLHNHTQYSLLDGLTKVPDLLDYVQSSGMTSVAITDHGTLSGVIEFYEEALKHEIKPIIGIETYVATHGYADKDPSKDKLNYHIILLAMNNTGYQNLMKLSTIANLEGMYYRPRVDHDLLEQYNEGLIVLSGCIGGEIGDNLRQGQYAKAKKTAAWYKKVFGDRYYFEVQDHGHKDHPAVWAEQLEVNEQIIKLAEELDIPCVVTCDAHYLKYEDREAHEILLCVQTGSFLSDEKRMSLAEFELNVTDPRSVIDRWGSTHPDFIANTKAVADRCNVSIDLGNILIPKFPLPKGETEKTYLHRNVYRGLAWRYGKVDEASSTKLLIDKAKKKIPEDVLQRAEYELAIIDQMNFNGYFLIIADFIGWGKSQGIAFGPGRGSAAGSIISYALKITELDPMAYELLFERFLNPDRISMPDIDIDIQDSRRDEVIQYCVEKYGSNRVANIVTFGRMAARNAVRDVARVLQVPYAEADRLAKMIPPPFQGRHIPLEQSLVEDSDLRSEYQSSETAKRVFDLAVQLEGTIRSHGVHAAGVVIAPDDIVKFVPLEMAQKGVVATQYSMVPIEELGLLKIDFLGLSNLTIIKNALRIIKKVYDNDIDINVIPLNDDLTLELFRRGDTTGVFQFESAGMKRYLKQLKPTTFDDLIAMNALYRPGPMQWIDDFIARKHGQRKTDYIHDKTKNALQGTYGVMVYQEQVMQIAKDLCGFTAGQADFLRKGVAKKKPEMLAALKKDFIKGALENSDITETKIEEFWRSLEAFAAYCFPKAHAACYATIAYQTAYLKAHYPAAFMAALMTSDFDDTDRLAIEITECRHMDIEVLPPDVNESFVEFSVVPGDKPKIRFGMAAIKNVGTAAVEEILRSRELDGEFTSIEDFLAKVSSRTVNRKALESLTKAGAFDRFSDRSTLLHNLDGLTAYGSRLQKQAASGQTGLFSDSADSSIKSTFTLEPPVVEFSQREQLLWERELLGLYLSQNPLAMYEHFLSEQTVALNLINAEHDGKHVDVGGAVADVRSIVTKNGQKMAFVRLEDQSGDIELVLFPGAYQQTAGLWERDTVVLVRGKVSTRGRDGGNSDEAKIIVDDAREITSEQASAYKLTGKKKRSPKPKTTAQKNSTEALQSSASAIIDTDKPERLYIRLSDGRDHELLLSLKGVIDDFHGDTEVVLVLGSSDDKQIIKLPNKITTDDRALDRLRATVGHENVKVQ
ncbi:MAG TPA: DNA polymerase III subunit alpha [Candidatus Saccharimonadales bacterium]|nr:DNA polymerase III subunit alpha [Candidatus Saccharimonadales bacterium]